MYTLILKDNGTDIELMVTRALLALSAAASFTSNTSEHAILSTVTALLLLLMALFTKALMQKFRIGKILMLLTAAVLLFISTQSLAFSLILLFYGSILKFFYTTPAVHISTEGICIRKLFSKPLHPWGSFNNVILKDNLLTLDFRDNKLLQLEAHENAGIDEKQFNNFCAAQLTQ